MVQSVKVYFISREFTNADVNSTHIVIEDDKAVKEYEEARTKVCATKKAPVVAASVTEVSLSGLDPIDGISLSESDRVLVKDQADKFQNGIYKAGSGRWSRTSDSFNLTKGSYVFVEEGVQNIGSGWYLEGSSVDSSGRASFNFVKFSENGTPSSPDFIMEERVEQLKSVKEESALNYEFFYKNAEVFKVFGGSVDSLTNEYYPAWLNPSMVSQELRDQTISNNILVPTYEGEEPVDGRFELYWDLSGCREGDYFVCWSWRPSLSGDILFTHQYFAIGGGIGSTASIPTHRTDKKKYELILERYTPEMFRSFISEGDLTPMVVKGLNGSVASGFTMIENLANQIIDLLDSNSVHEQLLPLLSNIFALRLKSSDPTLWRRQIKRAVPNFKKKGTIIGLRNAYSDIGVKLLRLSRLWQVVSKYTFQEHFEYQGGSKSFVLSQRAILPLDENFSLWFRSHEGEWEDVTEMHESLIELNEDSLIWIGDISERDSFRILYRTKEIPSSSKEIEDYIRYLPLLDARDERNQSYPPKNWNTRVIEEDDPFFSIVIPVKHPISDPILWGWVRTEFPYGENAYNMDEYNGSKRESQNPCDIEKEFIDPCGNCQSSMFNLDLEVENLSDAGFEEVKQVAEEFMPFHSVAHTFNVSGSRTEFVGPVEETIETFVNFSGGETILAGEGQHIFNRYLEPNEFDKVRREMLSSLEAVESPSGGLSWTGTIANERVCLYPSSINSQSDLNDYSMRGLVGGFGSVSVDTASLGADPFSNSNLLEIVGVPSKYYSISKIDESSAEIYGEVDQSVVGPVFEYKISNKLADATVNIERTSRIIFNDEDSDFYSLGVVSLKDINDGLSVGPAWKLVFEGKEYQVLDLMPNDSIILMEIGEAEEEEGWSIYNGETLIKSALGGQKTIQNMGLVSAGSGETGEFISKIKIGDFIHVLDGDEFIEYRIRSLKSGTSQFYIDGYENLGAFGESARIYRRVTEKRVGQIGYEGLILTADEDIESSFPISNGLESNFNEIDSSKIRENYLLFIGSEYYTIVGIDGSLMRLGGRLDAYSKLGQEVEFTVYRFSKNRLSIRERQDPNLPGFDFDFIDRSGKALISSNSGGGVGVEFLSRALNGSDSTRPLDMAKQDESIEVEITYRNEERR